MKNPLVSVILPTYDSQDYIDNCIKSILRQTYKNFELIIHDDGSVDATDYIINGYMKKDDRIKFYKQDHQGIVINRMNGFRKSVGKYICPMDSDDMMIDDRIEYSLKNIKGNDIVYSGYLAVDINNKPIMAPDYGKVEDSTLEEIVEGQKAVQATMMFKRKCLEDHPPRERNINSMDDDHYLVAKWKQVGYKFKKMDTPVILRRYHKEQDSRVKLLDYMEESEKLKEVFNV